MRPEYCKLSLLVLTALTVNSLISCAPQGGSASPSAAHLGEAQGTQDSGGGTGVNGKVFESYIVDPTTLPGFKSVVAPIFGRMKSEAKMSDRIVDSLASLKVWYVAPVELSKISKDLLGVSFMNSSTQQIARQTKKEIWIDKSIYDSMSEADQGDLILHELVMTMYFYKFMKLSDFCAPKSADCGQFAPAYDRAVPPETSRVLNDEDNANIRAVTGWLKTRGQTDYTESEFNSFCLQHGFDRRFFANDAETKKNLAEIKISQKELYEAIRGAQITGQMPDVCEGVTISKSTHCSVAATEKKVDFSGFMLPGLNIEVATADRSQNFSVVAVDTATLVPQPDGKGGYVYLYFNVSISAKYKVGDGVTTQIFMFRKDRSVAQSAFLLESIFLKHGMIVGIDKSKDPICSVATIKPTHLLEDSVLIHKPNIEMNLVERMNLMVPPMAACSGGNVEDAPHRN